MLIAFLGTVQASPPPRPPPIGDATLVAAGDAYHLELLLADETSATLSVTWRLHRVGLPDVVWTDTVEAEGHALVVPIDLPAAPDHIADAPVPTYLAATIEVPTRSGLVTLQPEVLVVRGEEPDAVLRTVGEHQVLDKPTAWISGEVASIGIDEVQDAE